ncbi:short chain dehydrogenase Polysaccharide biosynthesis protein KR domain [Trypanosoma vivax]|uniref:3-dehydrosphinganine reductase n=1 Tax=Trypanosoma vivax (strain Y486) TaxID=1055687 RepID=G0U651_TRYVY|nr:putative short chain dehydrogenase [Trypanosoma vivax]KAH8607933.1 short chain dehydrogenase Polysaccharide biosynthesis protein KR domain [Trypanosoma vivax]CCC51354.1 putative short chain dehydrogenase [Trypanosoma vivax Y486]
MTLVLLVFGLLALALVVVAFWCVHRVPTFQISGCCALITGGSQGIGLEIGRELVRRGARLVVIAARSEKILQEAVVSLRNEVGTSSSTVAYVVMDVSDQAAVSRAMEEVGRLVTSCGRMALDLVVCSAGFAVPARFLDLTPDECRSMMDVNFFGCVNVVRGVLPTMVNRRSGRIMFISSLAAYCPIAGYSVYSGTKAAIRALAHSIDMEYSCFGVRCQVVSPPDVLTPGFDRENTRKSPECHAISSFGADSPVTAQHMAQQVVRSLQHYRFDTTVGFDKQLLCWCVSGAQPATGVIELLLQMFLNGWVRLAMAVLSRLHYGIVCRVRMAEEEEQAKKSCKGRESKKNA